MSQVEQARATLKDLYGEPGKAELIGGRIVPLMPTGRRPNVVAGEIFVSLRHHAKVIKRGEAYTDNMGFSSLYHLGVMTEANENLTSYYVWSAACRHEWHDP